MMIWFSEELDRFVREQAYVPYRLTKDECLQVGNTYWIAYRGMPCVIKSIYGGDIHVLWGDGTDEYTSLILDYDHDFKLVSYVSVHFNREGVARPIASDTVITFAEIKAACCRGLVCYNATHNIYSKYKSREKDINDYDFFVIKNVESGQHVSMELRKGYMGYF